MQLAQLLSFLESNQVKFELEGDDSIEITQVAGLDTAVKGEISFLTDKKYISYLTQTGASAVILNPENKSEYDFTAIYVENPYYVYALVAQALNPFPEFETGIHPTASVSPSSNLAPSAAIEACVVIKDRVDVGADTLIASGAVIEEGVSIGQNCRIGPNVTICRDCQIGDYTIIEAGSVIGGDGFGWANNKGQWVKIPQVGKVIVGSHVSIGNNVAIDRGAVKDTIIEDNCIIDNLVHIAHNVVIGSGSAIAGQVGFAGSTTLGKHCTIAGQAGFAGHIEIADNSHFLAKAGVTHDIKEPGAYSGFPAVKAADWQKNSVRIRQLDKLAKQIKTLQKQIADLTEEVK